MVPFIAMLLALEILLLPVWAGLVMARPQASLVRRLAILAAGVLAATLVLLGLAAVAEEEGTVGAVLRAEAVALGFAVLLAGLAVMLGRIVGPRATQVLTALLGWLLVAGIILAGPAADLTGGAVQETIVRAAVHANPLVVAEREVGLDWLHGSLTYRLTPLGDSYSYLLRDMAWWKTMLAHLFVGSGLVVFSLGRRHRA